MNETTKKPENRFCVYTEIDHNGEIFYVADGIMMSRSGNQTKIKGRSNEWHERAKNGYTVKVLYNNLTKKDAVSLCEKTIRELTEQGVSLVNKSKRRVAVDLTREMFQDYFEIDPKAKYGLVWKINGRRIWPGKEAGSKAPQTGYICIRLNKNNYFVHRVVYALQYGTCPGDMQINHKDGNKQNNKVENLELVTGSENVRHAIQNGLTKILKGEECTQSILSDEIVLKMYDMFRKGMDNFAVAEVFGIEWKHVSLIRNGKRWKHLYAEYGEPFRKSAKPLKITDEQILKALKMFDAGYNNRQTSKETGIEASQVSRIRNGKALQNRVSFLREQMQQEQQNLVVK